MPKYRGWVAQTMEMQEFHTKEEAREFGMTMRDKWQKEFPKLEFYFDIDDAGSEEEDEV